MSRSEHSIDVSIIIPVVNKLEFTRQCLDRIWRNTDASIAYEVIVVDNGSSDGTPEWFSSTRFPKPLRYQRNDRNLGFAKGNNIGAGLARGRLLLFLNNDTLVQPGWLSEMLRVIRSDASIGIVGIKQLFPYTRLVYHTGVVFAPGARPQHLYPHLDASLPKVNQEREYQAVNGACLLIGHSLFDDCGGFDEAYVNGYEDTDLCLRVGERGKKIVCCTSACIYHYAQISEGRTADDDANAARFVSRWSTRVRIDEPEYLLRDGRITARDTQRGQPALRKLAADCIYLADDLRHASAFTWVNVELALALTDLGAPVFVNGSGVSPTVPAVARRRLARLSIDPSAVGGVHIKWSHYWARHLQLELNGDINLEFFAINYLFGRPGTEPWDYWLQSLRQNHREKLPISEFCASVLDQVGIPPAQHHVLHLGYSMEVHDTEPSARRSSRFRFLTVTNSHDLPRYGTLAVMEAYEQAFTGRDDVTLVIKDYGASSGDRTLRDWLRRRSGSAAVEYITDFTDKRDLIRLYKSCDAFVSGHRGEGFGMKILDAMACGLPVITPLFGGPTSYCTAQNCYPVEFSMVPVHDGVDARSLPMTNQPLWADPHAASIASRMREVYADRGEAGRKGDRGRTDVLDRFAWKSIASRLVDIGNDVRASRSGTPRTPSERRMPPAAERSPYWLGVRVSVVVPTHNRKGQLLACLHALSRQSVLPQEFEVIVVDDGSTDGTREVVLAGGFPFALHYHRQDASGPGTARNLGIEHAAGEIVLFIGDDILADERLLEEHLLAHAADPDPGLAVLGHIDWPSDMKPNAVMEYVCGDAMLQFAYSLIPTLPVLDHRFFYTSNISLKREFLVDAAKAGIRFDPCFRRAAFEDSEFAYRLMARGLRIRYAERARASHDHWMDLDSFEAREFAAGEMAVVFYRKHPAEDERLQVRWLGELVGPSAALLDRPGLLEHMKTFDLQSDALLRSLAGSLEELLALDRPSGTHLPIGLSTERVRAGLHSVLRAAFDVQRTRGKVQEWFAGVDDPARVRAAQTLASVRRKLEFLDASAQSPGALRNVIPFDEQVVAGLKARMANLDVPAGGSARVRRPAGQQLVRLVRRLVARPAVMRRILGADRFIQARLEAGSRPVWLERYRRFRSRIRQDLL